MDKISLLLIDDHKLVRQGLKAMFTTQPDMQVIGEASDGQEGIELTESLKPDIILLDLIMPNLNGIDVARQLRKSGNKTRIIFLTMHANANYAVRALQSGALGYVLKDADFFEIVRAIHEVMQGRRYLSTLIADEVLEMLISQEDENAGSLDKLSPRERQVLQMIAEGHTNGAIAEKLALSVRTIEAHRAHLMAKLRITSHAELVRFAVGQGLVGP